MVRIKKYSEKKEKRNFKAVFFSIVTAVFLWFFVVSDNYFEHVVNVPIYLVNRPAGWILTNPVQENAQVLFRGTGKSLLSLGYRNKHILLDLEEQSHARTFNLNIGRIKGIAINQSLVPIRILNPDSIHIALDRYAEKKVPVKSDLQIQPMDGYVQVGTLSFKPDSITIGGPAVVVRNIQSVKTIDFSYNNLIKPLSRKIKLAPPSTSTVVYDQNQIEFEVDIERLGERVMERIPVYVDQIPMGIEVSVVPSTLNITVQGGVNLLSELHPSDIKATVNYRHLNRYANQRIPATIELPEGITFTQVKPPFFKLIINR